MDLTKLYIMTSDFASGTSQNRLDRIGGRKLYFL